MDTGAHPQIDAALRHALLALPDVGVAFCDERGILLAANDAMASMLGRSYRRTSSDEWSTHFGIYDGSGERRLEPGDDPLARALRGEDVVNELISVHADAGLRVLSCRAHRLLDPQGDMVGGVVFTTDVTRTVIQHRRIISLREKLIETVNHELRTPLAAVKGHLEFLEDKVEDLPSGSRWSIEALSKGLHRLETVVQSLRHLTELARSPDDSSGQAGYTIPRYGGSPTKRLGFQQRPLPDNPADQGNTVSPAAPSRHSPPTTGWGRPMSATISVPLRLAWRFPCRNRLSADRPGKTDTRGAASGPFATPTRRTTQR